MSDGEQRKKRSRNGPFLRWAGGKRRLAPLVLELVEESIDEISGRFIDPFLGGGAIPFAIAATDSLSSQLLISDINKVLIDAYLCVQSMDSRFVNELERIQHQFDNNLLKKETVYLELRELFNSSRKDDEVLQAARFVALNTTSFNCLWRENLAGEYNVPYGRIVEPRILDVEGLRASQKKLEDAKIFCSGFMDALSAAKRGDVVFLDPPYLPLSVTSSFSSYHGSGFSINEHQALANEISRLINLGAEVILCNSLSPATIGIYGSTGLNINTHFVGRSIAADGEKRENVEEIIATSFEVSVDVLNDFGLCELKS